MSNNEHDKAVFCIADTRQKAMSILDRLRASGFLESEISMVMGNDGDVEVEGHTKAPEGATTGAGSGAILGGALGWMAGIGALAIPGLGPFIAAGPIMAALGGAAIGGTTGGITGGLIGLGFSEYEAKQYENYLKVGRALISVGVKDSNEIEQAKQIFKNANAEHVSVQSVVEAE